MAKVIETIGDFRLIDDGNCYTTHLFTIEKMVAKSQGTELWSPADKNIYTDWGKAHKALLRESQVRQVGFGSDCPNNIPTYCENGHNWKAGCAGCENCFRYRGSEKYTHDVFCSSPICL